MKEQFSVLEINRHRMKTDGKGITTLVALAGCPLSCPYCINKEALARQLYRREMTPKELVEELAVDHCYFLYTGGGVTFGGGESLLHAPQIQEFSKLCPEEWNINIETSLNVPRELLEPIANERFCFIIDVKAMQPERYLAYTGEENTRVKENLCYLMERLPQENYVVKVPQIPNFCEKEEVEESVELLRKMGVPKENIVTFCYVI